MVDKEVTNEMFKRWKKDTKGRISMPQWIKNRIIRHENFKDAVKRSIEKVGKIGEDENGSIETAHEEISKLLEVEKSHDTTKT